MVKMPPPGFAGSTTPVSPSSEIDQVHMLLFSAAVSGKTISPHHRAAARHIAALPRDKP
jgi:hypothetical protein